MRSISGHSSSVLSIASNPETGSFFSCASDTTLRQFDEITGNLIFNIDPSGKKEAQALSISSDNKILASGNNDRTITLWDTRTGESKSNLNGHENQVKCIAFSRSSKKLVSGIADKTVRLGHRFLEGDF